MNEINSSKRLKYAAAERAEGDKILQVKAAEAEAESKYLSGVGVAKQRKAIGKFRFLLLLIDYFGGILLRERYFDTLCVFLFPT